MYLLAVSEEIETAMSIARIIIAIFNRDLSSDCKSFLPIYDLLFFFLFFPTIGSMQETNQLRFQLQQAQSAQMISNNMNKALQVNFIEYFMFE